MSARLNGKVIWVTGGSRGIGAAIARACAAEGAKVVISSRKQGPLDAMAAEINADYQGAVIGKACHAGEPDAISALAEWIETELGVIDGLVNNAATNPHFGPMLTCSPGQWDKTFDVNLKGYFQATREVAIRLQKAKRAGSIVSIASVAGMGAAPLQGVYGMSKAAVISMTRTLAVELGSYGIRLNAVAPGLVETKFASGLTQNPEFLKLYTNRAALRRHGKPEELSGIVLHLLSDESTYTTGQTFVIDGGYTIA